MAALGRGEPLIERVRATETRGLSAIPARPVEQGLLGGQVGDDLRRLIIGGQLEPGTHLVEGALAERFDVSRGPVRDALRQLEAEGLVESRRRGVFVKGFTRDDLAELYSLREAIESLALSLAIGREDTDWSAAEAAVIRMTEAAQGRDLEELAMADLDFHTELYKLSGHSRVWKIWEQFRPTMKAVFSVGNSPDRDLVGLARTHERILEEARRGNAAQAQELLTRHNRDGLEQRMRELPSVRRTGTQDR